MRTVRALPFLILLVACATEAPEPTATCTSCHGSAETGPAPPMALGGATDRNLRGVGAHATHQFPNLSDPVACTECHEVPATVDAPGHIDSPWPAETKWGDLGKTGGATITWDPATLTCSGSYCHGGTFAAPGDHTTPVWNGPPNTQTGCGSCHQYPPPAPHPAGTSCGDCHAPTASGGSLADPSTHIDGIVQVDGGGGSCAAACHGGPNDPNPPPDLGGNTDTTAPGVGAHEAHLDAGVACTTCHPVPAAVNEGTHLDGTTDVVLGGIAGNGGVVPSWDSGALTCTAYCHGASLGGGDVAAPVWNVVDGSQATCSSCHGEPPPPPHPGNPSCGGCHPNGGPGSGAHIDGNVDF